MPSLCTLVALGFAACAERTLPPPASAPWNRPLAERARDPFPRHLPRGDGSRVTIPAPPQRIVSGTILTDGVLLEICPPDRIRALHKISTDPLYSPVAKLSAAFPRHVNGDAETILAEEPDLVFVASFSLPETRARLTDAGVKLLRIDDFEDFAAIASNLRQVGYALGLDAGAEALVAQMDATLAELVRGKERRAPWRLLLWSEGYTAGRGTLFQAMLDAIGAKNAAQALDGHAPLGVERALALDPDVLVVGALGGDDRAVRQRLAQSPALAACRAVARDRILVVDSALLAATSQHAALAARVLAERLDAWGKP